VQLRKWKHVRDDPGHARPFERARPAALDRYSLAAAFFLPLDLVGLPVHRRFHDHARASRAPTSF